jgi:hypothetical protein
MCSENVGYVNPLLLYLVQLERFLAGWLPHDSEVAAQTMTGDVYDSIVVANRLLAR